MTRRYERANVAARNGDLLDQRMIGWLVWKVMAPFGFLMLIYPLYRFVMPIEGNPFVKAFAHGDFLIFSALVLIEIAIEYKHAEIEEAQSPSLLFNVVIEVVRVMAFFLIFVFGFMKYDVVAHENLEPNRMVVYSWFSCSVAVSSVLFSIYIFWKVTHFKTRARLRAAQSEM